MFLVFNKTVYFILGGHPLCSVRFFEQPDISKKQLKYIGDTVPPQMPTTAQMANAIITTIFSTVICAPAVGRLDSLLGTQAVLLIGAGVSAVAVELFILIYPAAMRHQQKKEAMAQTE